MDEMTLTLNSPITEEQWDAITDVDFEYTNEIIFHTKHGKEVKFVKVSAQPDRKLIDDYMQKIMQNISPHTATEGVINIKYYLEQIYEQIYGKGEKPKWMI